MKYYLQVRVAVIVLFSVLASCEVNSPESKMSSIDSASTVVKNKSLQKIDLFNDPVKLIRELSKNGIGELKEWANPFEMGWGSLTDYYPFGGQNNANGMQNNIAYYLEGDKSSVSLLTINLNINNPQEKTEALQFLKELTAKTFTSLGLIAPHLHLL